MTYHLGAAVAGLTFVVLGALFLLDDLGVLALRTQALVPGMVIGLGVAAIVGAVTRRREDR